ncbi:hypothetical protein DSL72_000673 [Monilinia vaccinii-corymbosi]|uniref:Thioredoxin domain-containing protein n=1 Tax=Monilinia vaccinii-corymbosi TaxID=61207 RepID=A0A8A3P3E1_9HELO|nr:hypothetical protein DSL72_000673 [Monilinia vaccinii-corymbosi]
MPVTKEFKLPSSPKSLDLPEKPGQKLFLSFISSTDPVTQQPWCPDVRAALPVIEAKFAGDEFEVRLVEVGQRSEWRVPDNVFRTTWNVDNVPTLVRYERVDGEVKETGRLVENEILNQGSLNDLVQ